MKSKNDEGVYALHGCKDRNGYLDSLADDRGIGLYPKRCTLLSGVA